MVMLARGRRAEQIRAAGLSITGLTELTIPVDTLSDLTSLHSADVLVVATKTPGTAEALATVRHARVDVALSIQNGPLKNELLADAFGEQHVLGALADTSGELMPDGRVLFTRNVNIMLGELAGEAGSRAQRIAGLIDAAGVRATAVRGIRSLEWSKFAAWVGLLALSVTTRAVTWRYLSDPDSALVLVRLIREMGRLTCALDIDLTDESVMPVASICTGSEADAVAAVERMGRKWQSQAPGHRMSSLQDLEAARPLEIHETLGYALRKAAQVHIPLPLVDAFYRVVAAVDRMSRA